LKSKIGLYLISNLLLLSACGGKLDPVVQHESPATQAQVQSISASPRSVQGSNEIESALKAQDSPSFLENSKKSYLNLAFWQDARISKQASFTKFIDLVHVRLLELPADKRWSELSKHFDSLCQDDLKSCESLMLLKTSPKSSELLVQTALQQKEIAKKYKFLLMAFDIQNRLFPEHTLDAFLSDIKNYRESLITTQNQELLSRVDHILSLLMNLYIEGKLTTKDTKWIANLPLLQSLKSEDVAVAAKYAVTIKDGKPVSSSELVKEIEKNQAGSDSFAKRMKWVDEANPKLKAQLKISVLEKDAYFFVIDQLFTTRWSPKQADAFLKSASLSVPKAFETAQTYTYSQIAYIMALAQYELTSYLKKTPNLDASNLFIDAKKSLSQSSIDARALADHLRNIAQFFALSAPKSKEDAAFFKIISTLEKTIKISISYPGTLVLFDTASRLGITPNTMLSIQKFDAEGTMPFEAYVQQFFRGEVMPLLDYTTDKEPLGTFETGEAIEMAAKGGWFESMGRTPDEALTDLFEVYMQSNSMQVYRGRIPPDLIPTKLSVLKSSLEVLDAKYNTAEWKDAVHLCKGLQSGKTKPQQTLDLMGLLRSPTLGSFADKMASFEGSSGSSGGSGNSAFSIRSQGYFMFSKQTLDQMEWLRLDLLPTLHYFTTLKKSLEKSGIALPKLENRIESVKTLAKTYANKFKARFNEANDCWFYLFARERALIAQIVQYEKAYWEWAHPQILAGQNISSLFTKDLPTGMEYRTTATAQNITMYTWDLLLRARIYLQTGIPQLNLPPIAGNVSVVVSESLLKESLYKNPTVTSIPMEANAKSFSKSAIKGSGFSGSNNIVYWYLASYFDLTLFQTYADGVALFYRVSPILNQVLGIQKYFTDKQLLEAPVKVRSFLNLTDSERMSQSLLGISSRYIPDFLRMGKQFLQDNGQAEPMYDYILKSMTGSWMGSFGDEDIWENAEVRVKRPPSLIPFSVLASNIYQYQLDPQSHLFSPTLISRDLFIQDFKPIIANDLRVAAEFAKKVEADSKSMDVMFDNTNKLRVEPYTPVTLKDVDTSVERAHQMTGGIFR